MTSQLNVDTIVDKAGSGGTNVKIANNAVTVAEGGSGTTNTVQGLAKCWVNFNGTGTIASRDSFNIASLTDTGTGHYDPNFSNNMSNNDFSATGGISESGVGGEATIVLGDGYSTSSVKVLTRNSTSATDYQFVACTVNGDLA